MIPAQRPGRREAEPILIGIDRLIHGVDPFVVMTALATAMIRCLTQVLYAAQGDTTALRAQYRALARRIEMLADCPREDIVKQSAEIQAANDMTEKPS